MSINTNKFNQNLLVTIYHFILLKINLENKYILWSLYTYNYLKIKTEKRITLVSFLVFIEFIYLVWYTGLAAQ